MKTLSYNLFADQNTNFTFSKNLGSSNSLVLDFVNKLAKEIMSDVMKFRRTPSKHENCDVTCPACHSPHLPKVVKAIKNKEPITFILPAFPGKSPNQAKVLGVLPDMAEEQALLFLNSLCEKIQRRYSPGAKIILCSDGRVFSDVVGMKEKDVTSYQDELDSMIEDMNLDNLSTFNLDEICGERSFDEMRVELMERYNQSLEALKLKVRNGAKPDEARPEEIEANRMYCGITRFLVEDSTFPGQTKSRTAVQKDCRKRAYEVIRRSNAWSDLLEEKFPEAVRFSIHPQTCGSKKLGIRLMGDESWMTPWHGVAMKTEKGYALVKRSEAEALGAQIVRSKNGRLSHFELARETSTDEARSQLSNRKYEKVSRNIVINHDNNTVL